jgi:HK97 family phage prohead protease
MKTSDYGLETKFCRLGEDITLSDGCRIEGYASLFGVADQGGDVVLPGAYARSLARFGKGGRAVRMLWQHDAAQPIGVWEKITEDARGLHVRGRILTEVDKGREALALIAAGAIDGLSIGYRTVTAERDAKGQRLLREVELWEVSLVTFPMLPEARVAAKGVSPEASALRELAALFEEARRTLAGR